MHSASDWLAGILATVFLFLFLVTSTNFIRDELKEFKKRRTARRQTELDETEQRIVAFETRLGLLSFNVHWVEHFANDYGSDPWTKRVNKRRVMLNYNLSQLTYLKIRKAKLKKLLGIA